MIAENADIKKSLDAMSCSFNELKRFFLFPEPPRNTLYRTGKPEDTVIAFHSVAVSLHHQIEGFRRFLFLHDPINRDCAFQMTDDAVQIVVAFPFRIVGFKRFFQIPQGKLKAGDDLVAGEIFCIVGDAFFRIVEEGDQILTVKQALFGLIRNTVSL